MATKRTMEARPALEVELNDWGTITLTQELDGGEPQSVSLDPDQVPTVMQWLQELLEEHRQAAESK